MLERKSKLTASTQVYQPCQARFYSIILGSGTSLSKLDFINANKLNSTVSLEDSKTLMQQTLQRRGELSAETSRPAKDRSVQQEAKFRWPNGEVPYFVENVFTISEKALIASVSNRLFCTV